MHGAQVAFYLFSAAKENDRGLVKKLLAERMMATVKFAAVIWRTCVVFQTVQKGNAAKLCTDILCYTDTLNCFGLYKCKGINENACGKRHTLVQSVRNG